MSSVRFEECNVCPVRNGCMLAVEPGSVMCSINKMRSGKTHRETYSRTSLQRFCPHCGKPLN